MDEGEVPMVTVALIGADGSGKTTIGRELESAETIQAGGQERRIKYIYMGANPAASNHTLLTTRMMLGVKRLLGKETHQGGPPDPDRVRKKRGIVGRSLASLKSSLMLINRLGEEWYRQLVAWRYERRGYVVLFDRHFYSDYYAHDIAAATSGTEKLPLSRRIHGFVLDRFYPRPDLIVLLDAPAQVLFDRKAEGTVELLERRRQEYLQLRERIESFAVVDATRDPTDVASDVLREIRGFCEPENGAGQPA
jgi:thymidylate kinase